MTTLSMNVTMPDRHKDGVFTLGPAQIKKKINKKKFKKNKY